MEESPAYRLNHEEIIKALEEGISFIEGLEPQEAVPDEHGKLAAVRFLRVGAGETRRAAGAHLPRRGRHDAEHHVREGVPGRLPAGRRAPLLRAPPRRARRTRRLAPRSPRRPTDEAAFFTGYSRDGKFITFFGDNHPAYNGNVVKAMASARQRVPGDRRGARRATRRRGRSRRTPSGTPSAPRCEDRLDRARRRGPPPDAHDRRGRRPGAGRGARTSSPASSSGSRTSSRTRPAIDGSPLLIEPSR